MAIASAREPRGHDRLEHPRVTVQVCLRPSDLVSALRTEAKQGLSLRPREMSPKWLYDDRGSLLFDEITRLPEYYPTRREREILLAHAREIAELTGADTLVELGSGTSEKTRFLLSALAAAGTLARFVPFDVSERILCASAAQVAEDYSGIAVHAVVGDFERHLGMLPTGGRRLFAFLGGTLGNFKPAPRRRFLSELSAQMAPGDALLLGTDLVKDVARVEAAYNDSAGITAAFNLNLLCVLNRALGGNFVLGQFEHVARFNPEESWIEMLVRARCAQRVALKRLEMSVDFAEGELMRTEVSTKFRPAQVEAELGMAGLSLRRFWTDSDGDFALSLASKPAARTAVQ